MNGSFAIGVEYPKTSANIGTLLRSAYCLGAAAVLLAEFRGRALAVLNRSCSDHKRWEALAKLSEMVKLTEGIDRPVPCSICRRSHGPEVRHECE